VTVVILGVTLYFNGFDIFYLWLAAPVTHLLLPAAGTVLVLLGLLLMIATMRPRIEMMIAAY